MGIKLIHQLAQKREERHFHDRNGPGQQGHKYQVKFYAARVMATKRKQGFGWLLRVLGWERFNQAFKKRKHGNQHLSMRARHSDDKHRLFNAIEQEMGHGENSAASLSFRDRSCSSNEQTADTLGHFFTMTCA